MAVRDRICSIVEVHVVLERNGGNVDGGDSRQKLAWLWECHVRATCVWYTIARVHYHSADTGLFSIRL